MKNENEPGAGEYISLKSLGRGVGLMSQDFSRRGGYLRVVESMGHAPVRCLNVRTGT